MFSIRIQQTIFLPELASLSQGQLLYVTASVREREPRWGILPNSVRHIYIHLRVEIRMVTKGYGSISITVVAKAFSTENTTLPMLV